MITPLTNKINYGYGSNISDYRSNNILRELPIFFNSFSCDAFLAEIN